MESVLIVFSLSIVLIYGVVYVAYEKIKYAYVKRNDEIEILKRNLDINNSLIEKKLSELNERLDIDNIRFKTTLKKEYEAARNMTSTSINATVSSVYKSR